MDSNRIIVMDKGLVVEFDTPLNLLNQGPGGVLYELCDATGNMHQLRELAEGRGHHAAAAADEVGAGAAVALGGDHK